MAFLLWHLQARHADGTRRQLLFARSRAALWLLTALLCSGLLVAGLKIVFGRARPRLLFEQGFYGFDFFSGLDWTKQSFPSGHSQTIWVAMTVLAVLWPNCRLAFIVVGGLVSTSRVVTTVHYLSDVVMGTFLGIACTVLLRNLFYHRDH
ncbi:phosphoesterase PA-phosphatase related [invertebrate metagenome]|uniref:Phosphoesterase PA-phosphatase related n=1 Tax=invertebrate metagenome TaxID=1711999 RepID=A0A484H6U9_9ZZZZ